MKYFLILLIVTFCLTSFATKDTVDTFEVYYDSTLVTKAAIELKAGKSLQVVSKNGGKIYKVELAVVLGKRPCYQKTYVNDDAAKPILVDPFIGGACIEAASIMLTINLSTTIVIPIL